MVWVRVGLGLVLGLEYGSGRSSMATTAPVQPSNLYGLIPPRIQNFTRHCRLVLLHLLLDRNWGRVACYLVFAAFKCALVQMLNGRWQMA